MSIIKYGATPEQTSKTAAGSPGSRDVSTPVETLKEKLAREKRERGE